jgi:HEAT repeat protein
MSEAADPDGPTRPDFPPAGDPPLFDPSSGPALAIDTVEPFLEWLASVPVGHADVIGERVAAARGNDDVLDRLLGELEVVPVEDVSRHCLLLSTLGELRDPAAVERLARFIWNEHEIAPSLVVHPHPDRSCRFEVDGASRILRMHAAEMLGYIGGAEAIVATLKVAESHPVQVVRLAAADAYLFGQSDSPEALQRLRDTVPQEDRSSIGLPRLTSETDPEEFQKAVSAYYERYPDEFPPQPTKIAGDTHGDADV